MLATAAIAVLLLWHVGESLAIAPHYLAYFNAFAGGPSQGYRHLIDSSLDWGQDLRGLKDWLDRHGGLAPEMKKVRNGPELWAIVDPCPDEIF